MARPRQKKDNRPVSIRMRADLAGRLDDYCTESGQPKTTAIERAVEQYIDEHDNNKAQLEKILNLK